MEAATSEQDTAPVERVSSFAKSLFLGEVHEDLVFPYPQPAAHEQDKIRGLVKSVRELAATSIDPRKMEDDRWVPDELLLEMGERGLMGLYVPEEYGGQGLSQTGYCRVFEEFAQIDPTLSVVLGVHQSIGMKGIVLFGSDEQKERFLPDLASGRKLAAFALTEPNAGSDAYNIESRAVRRLDRVGHALLRRLEHRIGAPPDTAALPPGPGSLIAAVTATEAKGGRTSPGRV